MDALGLLAVLPRRMNLLRDLLNDRLKLLDHIDKQRQRRFEAVLLLRNPHPELRPLDTSGKQSTLVRLDSRYRLVLHGGEHIFDRLDLAASEAVLVSAAGELGVYGELAEDGQPVILFGRKG